MAATGTTRSSARPASASLACFIAAEASSIRVSVEKVDQLINLVGELVITQAMLAQNSKNVDAGLNQQLLSGLADGGYELTVALAAGLLAVGWANAGVFSVDHYLRKRRGEAVVVEGG